MNRTIIFDGSNLLHRCYWVHTTRPNIKVEHLFLNSIKKAVAKYGSSEILCVWDERNTRGVKNYRRELTTEYKQTRDKDKNKKVFDFCDSIKKVSQPLGVIHLHPDILEADDYINWLSVNLNDTVIISSDGDLLQCCTSKCMVYNPIKDIEITSQNFHEITGVNCTKDYVLLKAIMGDKSDNIAGVPGVGQKRAMKILEAGVESLTDEHRQIVDNNIRMIDLSTACDNHPNEIPWYESMYRERTKKSKVNMKKFRDICSELNLNTITKNIKEWERSFDKNKSIENVVEKLIRINM